MDRSELLRLAQLGAQARLNVLQTEIQQIYRQFPGLKTGRGVRLSAAASARKGRRKMSAAERKAVSERMTRYWAARRKAKKQA